MDIKGLAESTTIKKLEADVAHLLRCLSAQNLTTKEVFEKLEALEAKQAPAESEADKNIYQLAPDSSLAVFLASESEPVVDTSWPQKGDAVWYLTDAGEIYEFIYGDGSGIDNHRKILVRGNLHRTREEAEKADLLDVAMHELKVMSEKEWAKPASQYPRGNYYAVYDVDLSKWYTIFGRILIVPGAVSFPTDASAMEAVKLVDAKYEGILR